MIPISRSEKNNVPVVNPPKPINSKQMSISAVICGIVGILGCGAGLIGGFKGIENLTISGTVVGGTGLINEITFLVLSGMCQKEEERVAEAMKKRGQQIELQPILSHELREIGARRLA